MKQRDLIDIGERDVHGVGKRPRKLCIPAQIGTGPKGETCRSCKHKTYQGEVAGRYLKCALMRKYWTRGGATDIKAGWPACAKWEKR